MTTDPDLARLTAELCGLEIANSFGRYLYDPGNANEQPGERE